MTSSDPGPIRRPADPTRRATREMRRAERLAEHGRVDEAIESVQAALRFGADRYTCYLRLARLYQASRQWPEAVAAAETAIAEHPDKIGAREAVIALHLEARDYRRAIDASKNLLKISPHHVPARDALGAAYIGLGDVEAAMRVATDLIRLAPNDAAHHFKKGLLCQHQGEMHGAIEAFERAIQLAPSGELADAAREQLDTLDWHQLNTILTLAVEDSVFRARLTDDPLEAVVDRGFYLSEEGRARLQDLASEVLPGMEVSWRPSLYH